MKVIIPLAGFGTRLRPHTYSKPKPLVPVAGKAVLGHLLDELAVLDVDEIIFIVGYLGEQIEQYVSQFYPQYQARYLTQTEMNGQSPAIYLAKDFVQGELLIIFGDTLFKADLASLSSVAADGVLHLWEVEDPARFGVAVVDKDGFVERLVEKPKTPVSNLVVVGVYYYRHAEWLFKAIEQQVSQQAQLGGEFYLADAMAIMLEQGAKFCTHSLQMWQDCGTVPALLETNRYLLSAAYADNTSKTDLTPYAAPNNVLIIPPVSIDPSAQIERSVIGPYVSIGANTRIANSLIQDSIIADKTKIVGSELSASLIGSQTSVKGVKGRLNIGDSSEINITYV